VKVPTALDDSGMHIGVGALRDVIHAARDAGHNPRKLLLNSPSNPTGLSIPRAELAELAALCEEERVMILSDEIYGLVQHDPTAAGGGGPTGAAAYDSAVQYAPDSTFISTGLSKHLSLGGWRLGLGFAPRAVEGLSAALCSIASETWICVAAPVQKAALEAFGGASAASTAEIEQHVAHCAAVHSLVTGWLHTQLHAAGISCPRPSGGFYLYPDLAAILRFVRGSSVAGVCAAPTSLPLRCLSTAALWRCPPRLWARSPGCWRCVSLSATSTAHVPSRRLAHCARRMVPRPPPQPPRA